jgi:gpW
MPSCADALSEALSAYHKLMTGSLDIVKLTRPNGEHVEYAFRNAKMLFEYIKSLNQQCPCAQSYAVLGIPLNRQAMQPIYGFSSGSSYGGCCGC